MRAPTSGRAAGGADERGWSHRDLVLAWRCREHAALLPPEGEPFDRARELVHRSGLVSVFVTGELPSLYRADGSMVTRSFEAAWEMADRLSATRQAFYGRLFRGKATLVSREMLPWLWAALRRDPADEYGRGRLSRAAVTVYRHLQGHGPLPADRLRRELGFADRRSAVQFRQALGELEGIFAIAVLDRVRVHWDTFVWGPAEQWLEPGEVEEHLSIPPDLATRRVLLACLERVGACPVFDLERWFRWPEGVVHRSVKQLVEEGTAQFLVIKGFREPCVALRR